MVAETDPPQGAVDHPFADRSIDECMLLFGQAWNDGIRPSLEDLMPPEESPSREELLYELLLTELRLRRAANEKPDRKDYAQRFPNEIALVDRAFADCLAEECCGVGGSTFDEAGLLTDRPQFEQTVRHLDTHRALQPLLGPPCVEGDLGTFDCYRVIEILGAGAMGIVVKAFESGLERIVTLKIMRPELDAVANAKVRFLREAQAVASLQHSRIVVIHKVSEWKGTPYFVMPYMSGMSLADRIHRGPPIDLADAVRFIRETCDALAAAHDRGLFHRDIKPDNIWLEQSDEGVHVRLLDFGLVFVSNGETLSSPGCLIGTPSYVSPEQAEGRAVDGRSDLFSLGCVLYELTTGRRPFSGTSFLEICHSLANEQPAPPNELNPRVSDRLSNLTLSLLSKSPGERPSSALVVSRELADNENELTCSPAGIPKPIAGTILEHRTFNRAALAVIVGTALAGVALTVRPVTAPDRIAAAPPRSVRAATSTRIEHTEIRHLYDWSGDRAEYAESKLIEEKPLPVVDDAVRVQFKLTKPAYAYCLVLNPRGDFELCFPREDSLPPPRSDSPSYPCEFDAEPGAVVLSEGAGLWAFVCLVSEVPLPPFSEWRLRNHQLIKWSNNSLTGRQIVLQILDEAVPGGLGGFHGSGTRGINDDVKPPDDPEVRLKKLHQSLRKLDGFVSIATFGFTVRPKP